MKQNPFRKSFTFEQNFYNAVMNFIEEDRKKNEDKNFNVMYVHVMSELFKVCNEHFAGKEYVMSLMEREPGKKSWKRSVDADTNFGNVWECVVNKFLKNISLTRYESWPNGKSEFPDFSAFGIPGDFKAVISECYKDTSTNQKKGIVGMLKPDGHASLYNLEDYKKDIEQYKTTGILSDHLKAILVFAIYEYRYDEKTGVKYAHILNVMVCPAIFCINFNEDGSLSLRRDGITIGFQERNYKFISAQNFGI